MTNFEKYKDFFEKWAGKEPIAIVNNKPKRCLDISCSSCDLKKDGPTCTTLLVKWLYEEYKETPVLTKAQYYFLKSLNPYVRIKKINNGIELSYGDDFRTIGDSTLNDFFSGFPELKHNGWYDVSDMLKWKVIDDE